MGDLIRERQNKGQVGKRLACEGGDPVRSRPFPSWPHYDADEIGAVQEVLGSGRVNYWTGEEGRKFEQEYAGFVGTRYAVAVMNGTVALEAAVRALGVSHGDEVITTSRSFIASASCVIMRGGAPVMADVDSASQNMTADTIAAVLTPRTRGIIAVHLAGWPCDMDTILALAREKGLWVVEDCAQAHGATYKGRPVGSFGDAAAFSFCQDKIVTTGGEGGMLTTDRREIWEKVWSYKDHGKSFEAVYHREWPPGFRWLHESFGTNGRMTEMQAAIGRVQLRKLPQWVALRRRHAGILAEGFSRIPGLRVTIPPGDVGHAYYKYYVFVEPESLRPEWSRDRIMTAVCAEGVPCESGSCGEIYLEKAFDNHPSRPADRLPAAQHLGETSLMFKVHPTLSVEDMQDTVEAMKKVMGWAVR
ncbi:MAG: DegT/DnrJ/EryC1/StrS aminotransferase family protein [Deltaproteobacteria bacterium]|nr:DegT/DnrJ/EryC1/StrS aminotransferase family protein [Deltaproteobacteria bacterium]